MKLGERKYQDSVLYRNKRGSRVEVARRSMRGISRGLTVWGKREGRRMCGERVDKDYVSLGKEGE